MHKHKRRAQMRYRAGQVFNAVFYIIVSGIVATVLLSLQEEKHGNETHQ